MVLGMPNVRGMSGVLVVLVVLVVPKGLAGGKRPGTAVGGAAREAAPVGASAHRREPGRQRTAVSLGGSALPQVRASAHCRARVTSRRG